jgi:hypothetical protein
MWKSTKYHVILVYVCSLSYPAYKAHGPYCHLCPFPLYFIFTYLINGTIFGGGGLIDHKMCFDFFLQPLSETFLILSRIQRGINYKCTYVYMCRPQWPRGLKADSHIACRAHAVPLPCRALIHTCHAIPLPCCDSAVSFVKVRVVAGNIRTASPTV